jgi:hypothetical protein
MSTLFRLLGPVAAAAMLAAPVGDLTMILVLFVALNAGLAAMVMSDLTRRHKPDEDARLIYLRRRTIPHLRARHPTATVQAQVLWRQAAEAHRRSRDTG